MLSKLRIFYYEINTVFIVNIIIKMKQINNARDLFHVTNNLLIFLSLDELEKYSTECLVSISTILFIANNN